MSEMKGNTRVIGNPIIIRILACFLLVALPLAGIIIAGNPLEQYLQFPPLTRYVEPAQFSWLAFGFFSSLIVAFIVIGIIYPLIRNRNCKLPTREPVSFNRLRFGTILFYGLAIGIIGWVIAWIRLPFLAPLQPFTFTPLWIGYILVINALTYHRTGRCMMLHETRKFFLLFLISAVFWWFFEYLNRFVQNWYYLNANHLTPWQYFLFATPPFATVLPAVLGTAEYLRSFRFFDKYYQDLPKVPNFYPTVQGGLILGLAVISLPFIGILPSLFFPLLWISPLLIIISLQELTGRKTVFSGLHTGDWRLIITCAFAALICGFFWEMWNYYSWAKWIYAVPFVNAFHVFEMPILGYSGYLPFGLECAAIAELMLPEFKTDNKTEGE